MRGEPYTACKLHVTHGDAPPTGAFLRTSAASAYRVDHVAGRTLHCVRWPPDEIPADALVIPWYWTRR